MEFNVAKIIEQIIVIKLSKLTKNDDDRDTTLVTDDIVAALEQVAQELAEDGVIVEIEHV